MNQPPLPVAPSRRRRWIAPATAAGAGGTALLLWLEELMLLAAELISLIFLPILAGVIFLFNHLVFRSSMPGRVDLRDKKNNRGE